MGYWPRSENPQPIAAPLALVAPPGRTTTAIRFPAPVHARLKAAADERGLSINYLTVKAVEEFLERLIPADEWRLTRLGACCDRDFSHRHVTERRENGSEASWIEPAAPPVVLPDPEGTEKP